MAGAAIVVTNHEDGHPVHESCYVMKIKSNLPTENSEETSQ
jgi:hypothetical protein